MSASLIAALADSLPKYDPSVRIADSKSGGDASKPKNDIIRLEKFVVTERKPPVFTERQLYTKKGLADLMRKRLGSLKSSNFFGLPDGLALAMYEEQERLDNLTSLADAARSARNAGDAAGAAALERDRLRMRYRPSSIGGSGQPAGK